MCDHFDLLYVHGVKNEAYQKVEFSDNKADQRANIDYFYSLIEASNAKNDGMM